LFDVASKRGLEGIVGKDASSPYVSGARTDYWVKFKNYRIEPFQIGGFTGSLNHIESLLFGIFKGKEFFYVGHTDKGLSRGNNREQLRRKLVDLIRRSSPFGNQPDVTDEVHSVEPKLTCRVRFLEWTQDGHMRHATVVGVD
jgi:bifunctional non-homologous end joining protein LigD